MFSKNHIVKLLVLSSLISFLNANDYYQQMNQDKKNADEKTLKTVWQSKAINYNNYTLKFEDQKLKLDSTGNIIMYLDSNTRNINMNYIFDYLKFDTKLDKKTKFKCLLEEKEQKNSRFCDHPFYSIKAADDAGGGLFSLGKSLLKGEIAIEKKFDKVLFAQEIIKRKDTLEEIVSYILNNPETNTVSVQKPILNKVPNTLNKNLSTNNSSLDSKKEELAKLKLLKEQMLLNQQIKKMKEELAKLKNEKIASTETKTTPKINTPMVNIPNPVQTIPVPQNNIRTTYNKPSINMNNLMKVKHNGLEIESIQNPSYEVQLAAVKQNGLAIQFIEDPSSKVQLEAIRQNKDAVYYIENLDPAVMDQVNR